MQIRLNRILKTDECTIGELYVNDEHVCDTLEDRVRPLPEECPNTPKGSDCKCKEKVYGQTAIPAGTYELKLTYSNRFKKILPEILNVPHFLGIRIHAGNTASDSEGCILVGTWDDKNGNRLINSRIAFDLLMHLLQSIDEPITITIENN